MYNKGFLFQGRVDSKLVDGYRLQTTEGINKLHMSMMAHL